MRKFDCMDCSARFRLLLWVLHLKTVSTSQRPAMWCLTNHCNEIGCVRQSWSLNWQHERMKKWGRRRGDGAVQYLNLWGPTSCVLYWSEHSDVNVSVSTNLNTQDQANLSHPLKQALHQAAPVSLECIQNKTSKTAKILRVGVIADQINCLWTLTLTLLNHMVAIYCWNW